MKLSTRVRYGIRAMAELAKHPRGRAVSLHEVAKAQGISPKYLEQMATMLKIAGLVESVRGSEGGYRLARPGSEINLWEIYSALDASCQIIDCLTSGCERKNHCGIRGLWGELNESIADVLRSHTIQEIARRELAMEKAKA